MFSYSQKKKNYPTDSAIQSLNILGLDFTSDASISTCQYQYKYPCLIINACVGENWLNYSSNIIAVRGEGLGTRVGVWRGTPENPDPIPDLKMQFSIPYPTASKFYTLFQT